MSKIRVELTHDSLRIYIGGLLHLHIDSNSLIAVLSWVERGRKNFCIEYTMESGATVLTEYDDVGKFNAILKELARLL